MSLATTGSNTLTTGTLLALSDTSSSSSTRSVMSITQDHASATGSTALKIQSDGGTALEIDSNKASSGTPAIKLVSDTTDANTISVTSGVTTATALQLTTAAATSGKIIDINTTTLYTM